MNKLNKININSKAYKHYVYLTRVVSVRGAESKRVRSVFKRGEYNNGSAIIPRGHTFDLIQVRGKNSGRITGWEVIRYALDSTLAIQRFKCGSFNEGSMLFDAFDEINGCVWPKGEVQGQAV